MVAQSQLVAAEVPTIDANTEKKTVVALSLS